MQSGVLKISGVLLLEPRLFGDSRGFFMESYNRRRFEKVVGRSVEFVQDNHSRSCKGVLRGLHYQAEKTQGKLVRVIQGEIFDVAVDIRAGSPTFGKWVSAVLSAENKKQIWVPEGMAHGFLVLSDAAEVLYKTTDYYAPEHERTLAWDDPDVGVEWPLDGTIPLLSEKDRKGLALGQVTPLNVPLD